MFEPANYGPTVQSLLGAPEPMPLAPVAAAEGSQLIRLREASLADLFAGVEPASLEFAQCVRSALFLYCSALDESHRISQDINSPTGSYLHAIMHRREPDYSNAKYWFARVGRHELYPTLQAEAARLRLRDQALLAEIEARSEWDPIWFVDQCEQSSRSVALRKELESIQMLEWTLLFDYSYRRALSG